MGTKYLRTGRVKVEHWRFDWRLCMAFFQEFFRGGTAKIVIQISIVVLIFLLFLDNFWGRGEGKLFQPPSPVEESQCKNSDIQKKIGVNQASKSLSILPQSSRAGSCPFSLEL